jgi:hypothetical protein
VIKAPPDNMLITGAPAAAHQLNRTDKDNSHDFDHAIPLVR